MHPKLPARQGRYIPILLVTSSNYLPRLRSLHLSFTQMSAPIFNFAAGAGTEDRKEELENFHQVGR